MGRLRREKESDIKLLLPSMRKRFVDGRKGKNLKAQVRSSLAKVKKSAMADRYKGAKKTNQVWQRN